MKTTKMAALATAHCLIGCAIGELAGLEAGRLLGLEMHNVLILASILSFVSGYAFSTVPLLRVGVPFRSAIRTVFAADTLSILTMTVVDNLMIVMIPGAMAKDPFTLMYWASRVVSLTAAFLVAWPVNYWLLLRGKGHALMHQFHENHSEHSHKDHQ